MGSNKLNPVLWAKEWKHLHVEPEDGFIETIMLNEGYIHIKVMQLIKSKPHDYQHDHHA